MEIRILTGKVDKKEIRETDEGWHEKESKAETEVHGALKAAYYDAYHAARQEIIVTLQGWWDTDLHILDI